MYDINTKGIRKSNFVFYIFILIGLLFFAIAAFMTFNSSLKKKSLDKEILSTNVDYNIHYSDGETMYSPVYEYEVNGQKYYCKSSVSTNQKPSDSKKTILYNSSKPWDCMIKGDTSEIIFLAIFFSVSIISILVAVIGIIKMNTKIRKIKKLNKYGKLVKKLPYTLENSNFYINGRPLKKIVVKYTLPSGEVTTLYSVKNYDSRTFDADGFADLIIDENDPTNYFLDFEINRLTGNLKSDYYNNASEDDISFNENDTHYDPTNDLTYTQTIENK